VIILIIAVGAALVSVLVAFAAWIAAHAAARITLVRYQRDTNVYIAEIRKRQLANQQPPRYEVTGADKSGGIVVEFPFPPGAP